MNPSVARHNRVAAEIERAIREDRPLAEFKAELREVEATPSDIQFAASQVRIARRWKADVRRAY